MLKSMSFKNRMYLLLAIAMLSTAVMAVLSAARNQRSLLDARKSQLVTATQAAAEVVRGYQAQADAGKMTIDAAKKAAAEAVRLLRYGGADGHSEYAVVFQLDGTNVMHPFHPEFAGRQMIGKMIDSDGSDIIRAMVDPLNVAGTSTAFATVHYPRPGKTEPLPKLMYSIRIDGWNWLVSSGLYMDEVEQAARAQLVGELGVMLTALLVVGVLGTAIMRSVLNQIGGEPSAAHSAMAQVASGNLTVAIAPAPEGSLLHGLSAMLASLRHTVGQVRQSAEDIATASSEIANANQDLSSRTEQTASNLQEAAASMEQLTGNVRNNADSALQANTLASSAAEVASRGGSVVAEVVSTMSEINGSSKKISDIIGVIDGIAFQTNILALNAAVEAARAGEQGRGFAVVASEVRNLAGRSAEAAREVKRLIGASVERIETGSRLVANAGDTMNEIVASVQRVADIIGEVTDASAEQSTGIGQLNTAVVQLDHMTQQNAALVEQSAAAADSLKDQARKLAQVVSIFRMEAA